MPRIENYAIANLRDFLNTGETLCDIGQIDKKQRAWLNRKVKAEKVIRYKDSNRFPVPKFCYHVKPGVKL